MKATCPIDRWKNPFMLGDAVEKAVKPLAVVLGLPCIDEKGKLRPESGCAKRRDALNRMFPAP